MIFDPVDVYWNLSIVDPEPLELVLFANNMTSITREGRIYGVEGPIFFTTNSDGVVYSAQFHSSKRFMLKFMRENELKCDHFIDGIYFLGPKKES